MLFWVETFLRVTMAVKVYPCLRGVDLYQRFLSEGDILGSWWQPHFVWLCDSRGGHAGLFMRTAQSPQSRLAQAPPHSGRRPFSTVWLCLGGKDTKRDRVGGLSQHFSLINCIVMGPYWSAARLHPHTDAFWDVSSIERQDGYTAGLSKCCLQWIRNRKTLCSLRAKKYWEKGEWWWWLWLLTILHKCWILIFSSKLCVLCDFKLRLDVKSIFEKLDIVKKFSSKSPQAQVEAQINVENLWGKIL